MDFVIDQETYEEGLDGALTPSDLALWEQYRMRLKVDEWQQKLGHYAMQFLVTLEALDTRGELADISVAAVDQLTAGKQTADLVMHSTGIIFIPEMPSKEAYLLVQDESLTDSDTAKEASEVPVFAGHA